MLFFVELVCLFELGFCHDAREYSVFWGKGLMTEAAQAALEWRSSEGATEIEAFIDPQNSGSIALALRLGMEATDTFSEGAQRYRACCDMLAASPEK